MNRKDLFCGVFSGLLLTLGFPKFGFFLVSWLALIPLLWALHGKTARKAFSLGFVCGVVHFASALHWIQYVVQHYGGIPLPLALACVLLLASYLALYPAVFCWAAVRLEGLPEPIRVLCLPSLWVALEFLRAHALTGFPWASLGYTQTSWNTIIQIADITGVYGVSWVIVLANAVLTSMIFGSRRLLTPAVLAICLAGMSAYGVWRGNGVDELKAGVSPWPVTAVQGNIEQAVKWDPTFQKETLQRYESLSSQAAGSNPSPRLMVWPETAVPFFYGLEDNLTKEMNGILHRTGVPAVFGSPAMTLVEGAPKLQNRAYLVSREGEIMGSYAKQHLVPFGEYVPYQKVLFFVQRLVQAAGDFVAGRDPAPIPWDGHALGVLICYEGIFPELARAAVRRGADVLVNITNDAWYGDTGAPYQHMEMACWRAVELRVPLIRAANTGISVIVDARGRVLGRVPLNQAGYVTAEIHPTKRVTLYALWGDLFAWLCGLVSVGGIYYAPRTGK